MNWHREALDAAAIEAHTGGHWFAEPSRDAWRSDAAELAFDRTVSFLREHLT